MEEISKIKTREQTEDILDFQYLKQKCIEEIQKLSGSVWTDYNFHDPGVTIVEILAFALTDLGYRTRFPVKELIASSEQHQDTLFDPADILSTSCVSLRDYHKLLLDIEGVKDVIVFPAPDYPEFSGIYYVNLEVFPEFKGKKAIRKIKDQMRRVLAENRSLCEDFEKIDNIQHELVSFEIDLDVNDDQEIADINLQIYEQLIDYLSPTVRFLGLDDLEEMGIKANKVYEGPLLNSGFILDSEFERLESRNTVSASDIIHFILEIRGVEMIKKLRILDEKGDVFKWFFHIEEGKAFKIDYSKTKIRFFKVGKQVPFEKDIRKDLRKIEDRSDTKSLYKRLRYHRENGEYRNPGQYRSIQYDFPMVYGLGDKGLRPMQNASVVAKSKQLKAYLLLFEQILANYLAQLEYLGDLFSLEPIDRTYSSQALTQVPGAEMMYRNFITGLIEKNIDIQDKKLVKSLWKGNLEQYREEIRLELNQIIEDDETFKRRRNRVLDHLLSRLAFDYAEYRYDFLSDDDIQQNLIDHKRYILSNFVELSRDRNLAAKNIRSKDKSEISISGLENRIKTFLKLDGSSLDFPFSYFDESFAIEEKREDSGTVEDLQLEFNEVDVKELDNLLFAHGMESHNYAIASEAPFKVSLLAGGKELAFIDREFDSYDSAQLAVNRLIRHLQELSGKCEAIFVLERILFRPHPRMEYFNFSIIGQNGKTAFIHDGYLDLRARERSLASIRSSGQDAANYDFVKESGEYRILLKYEGSDTPLKSHQFYSTKEMVDEEIENYVALFREIDNQDGKRKEHLRLFTKHYDLFNINENPYSFIATILIPNWPTKFHNAPFRSHLENKIREETPAHIYPDIKWVGVNTLVEVNRWCEEYQRLFEQVEEGQDSGIDDLLKDLESISEKLFAFFLRYES